MTNNKTYFIANWKMYGNLSSLRRLNKVLTLSKKRLFKNAVIVYCPPFTLIDRFVEMSKKHKIHIGAQDCYTVKNNGAFTGNISSEQIKNLGAKFVILGHSEKRKDGDTDKIINKKIISAVSSNLNIILCIGENLSQKSKKKTLQVIKQQLKNCLKNIKNLKNILIAYEPVWAIGSGKTPDNLKLEYIVDHIKKFLRQKFDKNAIKVIYGGSVNSKNIMNLRKINNINGFLIGGASLNQNKFIDIIKKSIK